VAILATVTTCGFCEYLADARECELVRRGPLVSTLVNRTQYEARALLIIDAATLQAVATEAQLLSPTLVESFGATGINIFQNNGTDANQHYPHYHMHVVPRYPGSDPTKIYSEKEFEPISISQQRELAAKILRGVG
jgi:histidine triad (HIT) family protein